MEDRDCSVLMLYTRRFRRLAKPHRPYNVLGFPVIKLVHGGLSFTLTTTF